jgi:methylglutaconyl-CoA hydratase
MAIATFDAQFALTEVKLGIIPSVISPHVIAAIGERYARRYMLTAERFSAAEAYRIGLVHEIVRRRRRRSTKPWAKSSTPC